MVIRHSLLLLEQLSDVEEKIKRLETMMREMGVDCDQEKLLKALLARKFQEPSGQ